MNWQPLMNSIKNETSSQLVEKEDEMVEQTDKTGKEATEVVVVVVTGTVSQLATAVERMEMELRIEEEEGGTIYWNGMHREGGMGQGCRD